MRDHYRPLGPPIAKHGRYILAADLDALFGRVYREVHADYRDRLEGRERALPRAVALATRELGASVVDDEREPQP